MSRFRIIALLSVALTCSGWAVAQASELGDENIIIRGVTLRVAPADQLIRPRNAPVILTTRVEDGAGVDVTTDALFTDTVVHGHLSGNGIRQDISAPLGGEEGRRMTPILPSRVSYLFHSGLAPDLGWVSFFSA